MHPISCDSKHAFISRPALDHFQVAGRGSLDYFLSHLFENRVKPGNPSEMPPNSNDNHGTVTKASDEMTPLLTSIEPAPITESVKFTAHNTNGIGSDAGEEVDEEEEVPLPKAQIFLLCYTSVVEPIAFFGIFPYINFMIEKVGNVEKEEVGFYSGLIESLFSATQMCVMLLWGKVETMRNKRTGKADCYM